jgi:hypothetical protein
MGTPVPGGVRDAASAILPPVRPLATTPSTVADLLPCDGLRRGATIAVAGSTSPLIAVVAGAMQDGHLPSSA